MGGSTFLSVYGAIAKMRFAIIDKLKRAGAVSPETAVTPEEADLSLEEIRWLKYLAGGSLSTIKKTENGRYYV
ncbi:hypothetical protein B6U79_00395 [Candidatus Bathyarchaeota archaeon ex4484_231]|nr:MAG: hypothetical protein B6U79_00395 [Candidatus Bathyarchaeota archaeon ex4484_231]RJS74647.1 MAG: hypothetical protein CW712_06150 [Candidatus Bathyarchaeota archaeon]